MMLDTSDYVHLSIHTVNICANIENCTKADECGILCILKFVKTFCKGMNKLILPSTAQYYFSHKIILKTSSVWASVLPQFFLTNTTGPSKMYEWKQN